MLSVMLWQASLLGSSVAMSPIQAAVEQIDKLGGKLLLERKEEEAVFMRERDSCIKDTAELRGAVKNLKGQMLSTQAEIERAESDIDTLGDAINDLAAAITDIEGQRDEAAAIRKNSSSIFETRDRELSKNLDIISRSIDALKSEKTSDSFLQQHALASVFSPIASAFRIYADSLEGGGSSQKLPQLLQMLEAGKGVHSKSAEGVVKLLEEIQEKLSDLLDSRRAEEATAKQKYALQHQAFEMDLKAKASDLASTKKRKSQRLQGKAENEGLMNTLKTQLKDSHTSLKDTRRRCIHAASAFEAANNDRLEQLTALKQAREVITSKTEGFEAKKETPGDEERGGKEAPEDEERGKKEAPEDEEKGEKEAPGDEEKGEKEATGDEERGEKEKTEDEESEKKEQPEEEGEEGTSFLQMSHSQLFFGIERDLRSLADAVNDKAVIRLAEAVRRAARSALKTNDISLLQGSPSPFEAVATMIKGMLKKMEGEMAEAQDHKSFCDKELRESEEARQKNASQKNKYEARIERTEGQIAKAAERKKSAVKENTLMAEQLKIAGEERAESHRLYVIKKGDASECLQGLAQAISLLQEYFGEDSGADEEADFLQISSHSDEAGGVVALLQVAKADCAKALDQVVSAEQEQATDYDTDKKDKEILIAENKERVKGCNEELSKLHNFKSQSEEDLEATEGELEAVDAYLSKLKAQCIAKAPSHEHIAQKRAKEIEGLKNALQKLSLVS